MINRNFANAVISMMYSNSSGASFSVNTIDDQKNVDSITQAGSFFYQVNNGITQNKKSSYNDSNFGCFTIGSGSRTPTFEDYMLEQPIDDTDFVVSNGGVTRNFGDYSNSNIILSQVWKYNGNSEITIGEIALTYRQSSSRIWIVDRSVIDPITVKHDDAFTIALTLGAKAVVTLNS